MSTPTSRPGSAGAIADEFQALHALLLHDDGSVAALDRLARLVVEHVPGCDRAGVTSWSTRRRPRSLAATDEVVRAVDSLQGALQDGPALAAAEDEAVVRVADLATDRRWPAFADAVVRSAPVRNLLALPLGGLPHGAVLTLHADRAGALDDGAVEVATLVSLHARVLLRHAETTEHTAHLSRALGSSRVIGIAVGVLMHTHGVTADEAFGLLRGTSMRLERKLRDVAQEVTETGALPGAPGPDPGSVEPPRTSAPPSSPSPGTGSGAKGRSTL